jgi:hypothetical protein
VPCLHLLLVHSGGLEWCPNGTGADGAVMSASTRQGKRLSLLDSDTLGDELVGEDSDHGDLGTLGHGVVEERWGSSVCDLGSSDDDGSTLGDVGDSSSGQEEGTVLEGQRMCECDDATAELTMLVFMVLSNCSVVMSVMEVWSYYRSAQSGHAD